MIIPPIRTQDLHGSGEFGAPRGSRKHAGVDLACWPGSKVCALTHGKVTKLGYPYNPTDPKKGHLRYVEVTFDSTRFRYFYIEPSVEVGQSVNAFDILGVSQDLTSVYAGITPHVHFEIINAEGEHVDPGNHFKDFKL